MRSNRYFLVLILFLLVFSFEVFAFDRTCMAAPEIQTVQQLEQLYSESRTVFLANVEIDYSEATKHLKWKYQLVKPILKGIVSPSGYLIQDIENCTSIRAIEGGAYLVFWKNGQESISNLNAVVAVYAKGKIYEEWVLNWVKSKT